MNSGFIGPIFLLNHYPTFYIGDEIFYGTSSRFGKLDPFGEINPLWDTNHSDLAGLPIYSYKLLTVDSSLLYLHPTQTSLVGFSLVSKNLGQTWTRNSFGPAGQIYKGAEQESSWVYEQRSHRLYNRSRLSDPYEEVDISSISNNISTILAEPDSATYMASEHKLFLAFYTDLEI